MPFLTLVTFITALQCNIQHFLANRVSEPLVRFKMAITLELKLCQSNFSREYSRKTERRLLRKKYYLKIFTRPVDLFLIPYFGAIFTNFQNEAHCLSVNSLI